MNQRLKVFLEYLNISNKDFAGILNVSRQQLEGWLNRNVKIPLHVVVTLCEKFAELNPRWFLIGDGNMILDKSTKKSTSKNEAISMDESKSIFEKRIDQKLKSLFEVEEKYKLLQEKYMKLLEELVKERNTNKFDPYKA